MLLTFVTILHAVVAIILIGLVLLQDSKSGAMGGLGVGNANSLLGASGATSLAATLTKFAAVIFTFTSITLAVMSSKSTKSVVDVTTPAAATGAAQTVTPEAPTTEAAPVAPATQTESAPAETKK